MYSRILIIPVLIFSTLLASCLVGCDSSDKDVEEVTLQLNWYHEAEFVGYYIADAKASVLMSFYQYLNQTLRYSLL